MATLNVTKDKGGAGRSAGMTVVLPSQEVSLKAIQPHVQKAGLDGIALVEMVSAMAMHERAGARFARSAGRQTEVVELRKLHKALLTGYTSRVSAFESLLTELGVPPLYVSPAGRMAGYLAEAVTQAPLLAGSIDAEAFEFTMVDVALTLVERSHANGQALAAIAAAAKQSEVTKSLTKAAKALLADATTLEQVRAARELWIVTAAGYKDP